MKNMVRGFYAVYYTGRESSGHFSLLVREPDVVGLEAGGGVIRGECRSIADGGVEFDFLFFFAKGTELVTGQKLEQDLTVPFSVTVTAETLSGGVQRANFPTGPVNFRLEKLSEA